MFLVKPSHEILYSTPDPLKVIEAAGRTCYKSEDKITGDSAEKFVKMVIKRGHHSVIEHVNMSVRFICDRGVTHELVRHRLAAYSQECVSGDTEVRKGLTIRNLYEREQGTCYDRTHNKTIRLRSVDSNKNVIPNTFVDVFYKGVAEVFEMRTKLGYTIRCTKDHRFLTSDDTYKKLSFLLPGDSVYVNGRPCLLQIDDDTLTNLYINKCMNPLEISKRFNAPYGTVLRRLQKLNIFSSHLNDKNKEKYTANHTQNSYTKMKKTIQQQYDDGRIVWNKGIQEGEHPSVDKQAESLRKNHHNNQPGSLNSNWRGGLKKHEEAQMLKKEICQCELCDAANTRLEVHHRDENIENNNPENLLKICCSCHHLLHHGWYIGTQSILDEITFIVSVGEEEVFDLQMADPYNNYIADGFVTHNSTRYCNYKEGVTFIIPPWCKDLGVSEYTYKNLNPTYILCKPSQIWLEAMLNAERDYIELLGLGWSPQQARSILPNALKTEIVMTANVREWMHVLKLRCSKAAHPQIRELMIPLLEEMKTLVPVIFDDIKGEKKCEQNVEMNGKLLQMKF